MKDIDVLITVKLYFGKGISSKYDIVIQMIGIFYDLHTTSFVIHGTIRQVWKASVPAFLPASLNVLFWL